MRRRIGVVGTGFIARSFVRLIVSRCPDLSVSAVLTRRPLDSVDFPLTDALTGSPDRLLEQSDVVFECSGDVFHATAVIKRAMQAGIPVVTLNSEFHVTTGSHFVGQGLLTEAEGDQPGCLAALRERVLDMGFEPLVYGNMKGFLNTNPDRLEMEYWAGRQGISIDQTVAATDGTKIQIEQAFVANAFGATIARRGMEGLARDDTEQAAKDLGAIAETIGKPIADYLLSRTQVPGVFIVGRHDPAQAIALRYFKMGDGPFYVVTNPHHLCSLEAVRTIRRVLNGGSKLLDNSTVPTVSVAGVCKLALAAGTRIDRGTGGFHVRGEAVLVAEAPGHVPIGALCGAVLRRRVEPGQIIRYDDVDLPDSDVVRIVRNLFP